MYESISLYGKEGESGWLKRTRLYSNSLPALERKEKNERLTRLFVKWNTCCPNTTLRDTSTSSWTRSCSLRIRNMFAGRSCIACFR
jgi:hypothetical protein